MVILCTRILVKTADDESRPRSPIAILRGPKKLICGTDSPRADSIIATWIVSLTCRIHDLKVKTRVGRTEDSSGTNPQPTFVQTQTPRYRLHNHTASLMVILQGDLPSISRNGVVDRSSVGHLVVLGRMRAMPFVELSPFPTR